MTVVDRMRARLLAEFVAAATNEKTSPTRVPGGEKPSRAVTLSIGHLPCALRLRKSLIAKIDSSMGACAVAADAGWNHLGYA